MGCACIKHYDFKIECLDTTKFLYVDLSEWMDGEEHTIPEKQKIEITIPDSERTVQVYVKPQSATTITHKDLGIPSCLLDGIFIFTVLPLDEESYGCGIKSTKCSAVMCGIECCLDAAFSTLGDEKYDELKRIENLLNNSKNSSELQKSKQANDEYRMAKKLLDKLHCECNC